MKENNKEKIVGVAGTLLFHAALFLLLYFLVMAKPPQEPEAGISVVMGDEFALTEVEVVPQSSQRVPQQPAAKKVEEPLIAQNSEESMPVDSLPSQDKKDDKAAEDARRAEELKERADNLMANAFGKGNSMGSVGGEQGEKDPFHHFSP